ncbi:MAG: DNA adenine methylase, partial [Nocardioides sp.]
SRGELVAARELDDLDDLERARRVWVQLTQSVGARLSSRSGWRFVHGSNQMSLAKYLDGYVARTGPVAQRLRNVSLECRPAVEVIRAYQRPDCLIYADPPYLGDTRHGTPQYADELLTVEEHQALLTLLADSPAHVAISGYGHDLYHDNLAGWHVHRFAAAAMTGKPRTEVLWTNWSPEDMLPFEMPL